MTVMGTKPFLLHEAKALASRTCIRESFGSSSVTSQKLQLQASLDNAQTPLTDPLGSMGTSQPKMSADDKGLFCQMGRYLWEVAVH